MNTPANHIPTYEDLLELPNNVVGEIPAGELVKHPRGPRHALAASLLGGVLTQKFDRKSPDGPGGFLMNQNVIWGPMCWFLKLQVGDNQRYRYYLTHPGLM